MRRTQVIGGLATALALCLAGCGDQAPPVAEVATPARALTDLARGEQVFSQVCVECHGRPSTAAPALSDTASWERRLQQDTAVLVEHAIRGHRDMPAKGGHPELTDAEVTAAVAYVVDRSRRLIRSERNRRRWAQCDPLVNPDCADGDQGDVLILHMLYLLGQLGTPQ
jgi:cytochrome c5